MHAGLTSSEHIAPVSFYLMKQLTNTTSYQLRLDLGIYHLYSLSLFIKYLRERERESTRDLICQKPMVYYTSKPIGKGIQTTSRKQNRLLSCQKRLKKGAKTEQFTYSALLNIKKRWFPHFIAY